LRSKLVADKGYHSRGGFVSNIYAVAVRQPEICDDYIVFRAAEERAPFRCSACGGNMKIPYPCHPVAGQQPRCGHFGKRSARN